MNCCSSTPSCLSCGSIYDKIKNCFSFDSCCSSVQKKASLLASNFFSTIAKHPTISTVLAGLNISTFCGYSVVNLGCSLINTVPVETWGTLAIVTLYFGKDRISDYLKNKSLDCILDLLINLTNPEAKKTSSLSSQQKRKLQQITTQLPAAVKDKGTQLLAENGPNVLEAGLQRLITATDPKSETTTSLPPKIKQQSLILLQNIIGLGIQNLTNPTTISAVTKLLQFLSIDEQKTVIETYKESFFDPLCNAISKNKTLLSSVETRAFSRTLRAAANSQKGV